MKHTSHIPCHILFSVKPQEQYSQVYPQLKKPVEWRREPYH